MTDTEYLEIMCELTRELERTALTEPYDPAAYNKVIQRIQNVQPPWELRRRRRPWWALITVFLLLIVLLWILYTVLSVLYRGGTT